MLRITFHKFQLVNHRTGIQVQLAGFLEGLYQSGSTRVKAPSIMCGTYGKSALLYSAGIPVYSASWQGRPVSRPFTLRSGNM